MLTLFGKDGFGSTIVEAACVLLGEPYERVEADPFSSEDDPNLERLQQANPLMQVPTVLLPDGTVLTESVAIILWLLERHPGSGLAPEPGDPLRPTFLRWLVYLPAAIYPMYTVGDVPERWVNGEDAQRLLKEATVNRTLRCWELMEQGLKPKPGQFLLGETMTILDLYVAMVTRWRPRRDRIRQVAPNVVAAAERAEQDPRIAELWARNFPPKPAEG
ncbi:glutathione S-transferase family protein [Aerophototrophica crusticola]|uniref:Glutathione S-transferase family protein n=1 Tax=Aerophototrophica crusticola TaxID=1709002 RepID=A0A858R340_9PROT|nr:glutathione S-transferase family protein [Rhodospirillaceae bacterium B3]